MGSRADMLDRVATILSAVSGLVEWPHGYRPDAMTTAVAQPGTRAAFALELPGAGALADRQRTTVHLAEAVVVGLLVDVRQADHRASLRAALEVEDDVIGAVITKGAVPGWSALWEATAREPVGGDGGGAPFLAVRVTFSLAASVVF